MKTKISLSSSLGSPGALAFPATPALALFAALALAPGRVAACSVCGCSLSSDWAAQGYGMAPGLDADVRYEYYNNDNLRSGTRSADTSQFSFPTDREIQRDTLNRNTWLDLDYVATSSWAVTVQVPYYDRFHDTIAPGDTAISSSQASGLGDVRVLARWQKFDPVSSYGFQFGLKLPTGAFDQNFATGPEAGTPLDRGLQLGTGTTDLLMGASWFSRPAASLGCFAQASLDQPLAAREGFLSSTSASLNGGIRYLNTSWLTPQIQINFRWDGRERGVNADTPNSGDTMVFVSPGLTANLGIRSDAFLFVQQPVYQRVNGLQLEPRWLLTIGMRMRL